jgi:hypothetical protein
VTLRARLLLVLVGVVAAGLVISDVVVYTQLRSFLVARVDPELTAAFYSASHVLLCDEDALLPLSERSACRRSSFPGAGGRGGEPVGPRNGLFPTGTIGELLGPGGAVMGKPVPFLYGGRAPVPLVLPPKGYDRRHRVLQRTEHRH